MGATISKTSDRILGKLTYDPEYEKASATSKKEARAVRTDFLEAIRVEKKRLLDQIKDNQLTPIGSTLITAALQEISTYLDTNKDASSDELLDKKVEISEKIEQLYQDDQPRNYFTSILSTFTSQAELAHTSNRIDDDIYKKVKDAISLEDLYYKNNQNESMQTYKSHVDELQGKFTDILKAGSSAASNKKSADELKAKVDAAKKEKGDLAKKSFSVNRIGSKILDSIVTPLIITLIILFGIFAGSLLSNQAIARPVELRTLFFIFGILFSIPVYIYFLIQVLRGRSIYIGALLFPYYSYPDFKKPDEISIIDTLFGYCDDYRVKQALLSFLEAAKKTV